MKLLIIEDNRQVAYQLKKRFSKEYIVDIAHTGEDGLRKARNIDYGGILLDLGLPDKNGVQVCTELRETGVTTPILIVTGLDSVDSRIQLFNTGADDYIAKPFNLAELDAHVTALTRRKDMQYSDSTLNVKDLLVDVKKRRVQRSGVNITLRRKEFDILEYLVKNAGRAISRQQILDHVWEADRDNWNNTVDVHIKQIRDKIDKPFAIPLIKTIYGVGYLMDDGKRTYNFKSKKRRKQYVA